MAKELRPRAKEEFSVLLQHAVDNAAAGDQFIERRFQLSPVLAAGGVVLSGSNFLAKP
jgi:hypothetical protein